MEQGIEPVNELLYMNKYCRFVKLPIELGNGPRRFILGSCSKKTWYVEGDGALERMQLTPCQLSAQGFESAENTQGFAPSVQYQSAPWVELYSS